MSTHATPLERLRQLILIERADITTLILYGMGIGLMSLATPIAVQALVNTIAFSALFQPLLVLTLVLLVLVGFSNTLAALQFYVVEMLQRRLFVRLFGAAARRLQQSAMEARDSQYLPELSNRFFDVVTLQKTAAVILLETLGYVLQTLIGMILLAFYHPVLLGLDLFIIAMLAFILFVMGKSGLDTAIEQSKAKYLAAAWLENIAANALIGTSSQNHKYFQQQTDHIAQQYLDACVRHFRILARQNIGALILHAITNTLLLGLGGWMVLERQLSLGQLIAAELVVNTMIYGLTRLGKTLDNFYELLTSIDKIGHLLDLPQEKQRGASPETASSPYRICLHDVSLAASLALDNLCHAHLTIAAGEHTVICGNAEHGSLLDLLCGLRAPSTGYIRFNDQDLRDLNLGQLRDSVALVREPEIIQASIADSVSGMREILEIVGLQDIVAAFPEHLNTTIHLNGKPFNREQCLRLTLTRALLSRPRLLLLDHVLDRIDQRYVPAILSALMSKDVPWTLIVSSQQANVIAAFERRVRLDNGKIVEIDEGGDNS